MSKESRNFADTLIDPFQRFFKIEASGSILLFIATLAALAWANSRWNNYYTELWDHNLSIRLNGFFLSRSFLHWINEGLMAIFFFVIGLEIKREVMIGELSSFKQGALPIIAALGGMIVPAIIYSILTRGTANASGWGIPMATDIAFSLGVLGLLGKRVPVSLKVFLVAFAIVDDLGAVLVITIFYNTGINLNFLIIGLGLFLVLVLFNQLKLRNHHIYVVLGFIIWYMLLRSGIHPAITGVLIAFTIPLRRKIRIPVFKKRMSENLNEFSGKAGSYKKLLNKSQLAAIDNMEDEIDKVQSPLQFLERKLHGFVTYIVIPLFALANAGIIIEAFTVEEVFNSLSLNVELSMVIGKLTGMVIFTLISVKLGIAALPEDIKWIHIIGLGLIGGMGFSMSLFISNLAFNDPGILNYAKIGILTGSIVSGLLGFLVLRVSLTKQKT